MDIALIILSVLIFGAVLYWKTKKHANDANIRPRHEREKDRENRGNRPG